MVFDMGSIFAYVLGLFLIYMCCWLFLKPLKWLFRLMISCLIGSGCLALLNILGGVLNFHIALNPLTALISGVLGVPGVIMTLVLQTMI